LTRTTPTPTPRTTRPCILRRRGGATAATARQPHSLCIGLSWKPGWKPIARHHARQACINAAAAALRCAQSGARHLPHPIQGSRAPWAADACRRARSLPRGRTGRARGQPSSSACRNSESRGPLQNHRPPAGRLRGTIAHCCGLRVSADLALGAVQQIKERACGIIAPRFRHAGPHFVGGRRFHCTTPSAARTSLTRQATMRAPILCGAGNRPSFTWRQRVTREQPFRPSTTGRRTKAEPGSWSNPARASGI
jgi:hypothetical protein